MSVHPARVRAVAYLRRKGTEAPAETVRSTVIATLSRLERRLETIDAAHARRKPDADTWCVQEVVDHLTASIELARGQLRALIEDRSPGEAIPAGLIGDDALDRSWLETKERLHSAHQRYLLQLARADDSLPLERKVPLEMVVKVDGPGGGVERLEWTEELDWKQFAMIAHVHTLEHLDQIERILGRIVEAT